MARLCEALHPSGSELNTLHRAIALTRFARELRGDRDFVDEVVGSALRRDPTLFREPTAIHPRKK